MVFHVPRLLNYFSICLFLLLLKFSDNWKHDIALIKLEKDLPIGSDPAIKAIALPSSNQGNNWPETGQECVMKGWGCEEAGE